MKGIIISATEVSVTGTMLKGKGKGFPYSLPSVGPRADLSIQAVSPQVTISHPPSGRLPLLSTRPVGKMLDVHYFDGFICISFVLSLDPTLNPSDETFISVQCASHQSRDRRGTGRCVRYMCVLCSVEEGTVGVSSLSGIFKRAPSKRGLMFWLSPDWHVFSASPDWHLFSARPPD